MFWQLTLWFRWDPWPCTRPQEIALGTAAIRKAARHLPNLQGLRTGWNWICASVTVGWAAAQDFCRVRSLVRNSRLRLSCFLPRWPGSPTWRQLRCPVRQKLPSQAARRSR